MMWSSNVQIILGIQLVFLGDCSLSFCTQTSPTFENHSDGTVTTRAKQEYVVRDKWRCESWAQRLVSLFWKRDHPECKRNKTKHKPCPHLSGAKLSWHLANKYSWHPSKAISLQAEQWRALISTISCDFVFFRFYGLDQEISYIWLKNKLCKVNVFCSTL